MTIHHRRALRETADQILANTPNEKRLVLLWAGVSALAALLTGLMSYLLDSGIAGTGGLSGMGMRSVLTTAQQVISTFTSIALPFWGLGYQHATLQMARRHRVSGDSLMEGFRRFGPGLRLTLLQSLLMGGLFFLCFYGTILFLAMTPLAGPAFEALEPLMEDFTADPGWVPSDAMADALIKAMLPMAICGIAVACLAILPLAYRLRFAQLRIMDDPGCGALQAMGESLRATRGSCIALMKLDLSFWWFWLLEGLIVAVTYGDSILPMLGISLPVSPQVAFWGFYVAAMALQVAVYWAFHNRVSVTYALAYDTLISKPEDRPLTIDN